MTLPFRRRHNDAEATHVRARALSSSRFLEPLEADDEAWLNRHLDACAECRRDDTAYAADRLLLRSLREKPIEPPRDLWAKTSAALDVAAAGRSAAGARSRPFWRALPVGAVAGVAVLLVVIAASLLPGNAPLPGQGTPPPVANATSSAGPGPTPIELADAADVPTVREGADGSFDFVFTPVEAVCPPSKPECAPTPSQHSETTVPLAGAKIATLTLAPGNDKLVYESVGGTAGEGRILIVPLRPAVQPTEPPPTPTSSPTQEPTGSIGPTPEPTPTGQIEIATGVTLVGDVGYSLDGGWIAFSAAPTDGSTGPDLYVYQDGAATATQVTTDHHTYFSAWIGNMVLASRIDVPVVEPTATPDAPFETPGNSGNGNGQGNGGNGGKGNNPSASPAASAGPSSSPAQPIEAYATSFVFDPAAGTQTAIQAPDVWMPVVDPTSRFIAYWSGTLRSTDGITWQLGTGQPVVDGWTVTTVEPTTGPSEGAVPSPASPLPSPTQVFGLAGHATPLVTGTVADFRARFDPDGIRLAVWVSEHTDGSDGRLHLVVIDPATGALRSDIPQPLTGVPALRRFSMAANRLAWVTPSGQDGQESTLQILGWDGDSYGQAEAEPGANVLILR